MGKHAGLQAREGLLRWCGAWQGGPMTPEIAVVPDTRPAMHDAFVAAVRAGGGRPSGLAEATALVESVREARISCL